MKHFKKFFSYLVALTMVLSLAAFTGVKVHAAVGNTLTLNGTKTGHTYQVYQIFTGDLVENGDNKVLSNVKWGDGVTSKSNADAADVAKRLDNNYSGEDSKLTIDDLINDLNLTKPVKTVTSSKDSTEIDGLATGYYLVKDKDGTQKDSQDAYTKFIVQVVGNTEVAIKSDVPTVEKKVQDKNDSTGETSGWQDSADYDVGDTVPYQITGTMPNNIDAYTKYKYVFTDTMSKGLTYADDAKITIGEKDVTSSFEKAVTNNNDGSTTVTWTCANLRDIKGVTLSATTTVVVNYTATLNKDAVIGGTGNPNTVNLTYSNNPNNGGDGETGKTPDDKNIVFTYKTVVNKLDQDEKTPLKGAGFTLQKLVKKDGKTEYKDVKTYTAGEETTFEFTGLDDGDYKLIESTTPAGYNTIAPIEFKISATHDETADEPALKTLTGDKTSGEATFTSKINEGSLTTNVVNKKGSTLPSTGGMGTTLLYVAGGILVACAAAYVVMSRKHSTNK